MLAGTTGARTVLQLLPRHLLHGLSRDLGKVLVLHFMRTFPIYPEGEGKSKTSDNAKGQGKEDKGKGKGKAKDLPPDGLDPATGVAGPTTSFKR